MVRSLFRRLMRRKTTVYLRPTIAGLWWLGTLFILFLIGWGYSNNLSLGIAMLVMAVTVIFLLEAHFNLEALQIERLLVEDQFAQRKATFRLLWNSRKKSIRHQIKVEWDGDINCETWITQPWEGLQGETEGVMTFPLRGHHKATHVKLSSTYPLGLFQAWCFHPVHTEAWSYPVPVEFDHAWEGEPADAENARLRGRGDGEEPAEFRRYSPGDPLGRVAWKVLARGLPAHTKQFESPQTERRMFRWPWGVGSEKDRSIIAYAIQASTDAGESWALETSQGSLGFGDDSTHHRDGLRMLTEAK